MINKLIFRLFLLTFQINDINALAHDGNNPHTPIRKLAEQTEDFEARQVSSF